MRVFGEIPGQPGGTAYPNRVAAAGAGVHRPRQAGISGAAAEGADSIVVNGGYEDDVDLGDEIVYTGAGGRDPDSGRQVADQVFVGVNAALAKSGDDGLPVRVLRGAGTNPAYAPPSGYRYDGLFFVRRYWLERGKAGFLVCRYRLVRGAEDNRTPAPDLARQDEAASETTAPRVATTVQRIVRNTLVAQRVKDLYKHRCQVCGLDVLTLAGPYAEGAHIRPLGRPHNGPDVAGNILCLCPNDHVRFDGLAIYVTDDLRVLDVATRAERNRLTTTPAHGLDQKHLAYHRHLCGIDN